MFTRGREQEYSQQHYLKQKKKLEKPLVFVSNRIYEPQYIQWNITVQQSEQISATLSNMNKSRNEALNNQLP